MIKFTIQDREQSVEVKGRLTDLIAEMGCGIRAVYDAIYQQSEEMAESFKCMMYDPEYMDKVFSLKTKIKKVNSKSARDKKAIEELYKAFLKEFMEGEE